MEQMQMYNDAVMLQSYLIDTNDKMLKMISIL
jgi:hypothetical protein